MLLDIGSQRVDGLEVLAVHAGHVDAEQVVDAGNDLEGVNGVQADVAADLDSFESVCYRMCAYHFDGVDYFSFPEAYASVTPEDVLQFIRQVIRPERAALSIILPNESEESA